MSSYVITKYSFDRAPDLGIITKVSKNKVKKLMFIITVFLLET